MRKTLPVADIINAANAGMIATDGDRRNAIFAFTGGLLHMADAYRGFWYAHISPSGALHTCRPPEVTVEQMADDNFLQRDDPAYRAWVTHAGGSHLKLLYGGAEVGAYHAVGEDFFEFDPGWTPDHKWTRTPEWHSHSYLGSGKCYDDRCAVTADTLAVACPNCLQPVGHRGERTHAVAGGWSCVPRILDYDAPAGAGHEVQAERG